MSRLYMHVAQHAFSFLDVSDLSHVHRTCKTWGGFVDRMPPIAGTARTLPDAPTPLTKHVARVDGLMPSESALAYGATRLRFLSNKADTGAFPKRFSLLVHMEELHLQWSGYQNSDDVNHVLNQIGQLTQLHTCLLDLDLDYWWNGTILWSCLKTCSSLRVLGISTANLNVTDFEQLRSLTQLQKLSLPTNLTNQEQDVLLRSPFPFPCLQTIVRGFLQISNANFVQLPDTMTHLRLHVPQVTCFKNLGRMRLVRLNIRFVYSIGACQSLLAALETCVHVQSLSLTDVDLTDEQLVRSLRAMPHLTRLVLWNIPLRSARFLSQVPHLATNLTELHVRCSGSISPWQANEVRHVHQLAQLKRLLIDNCFSHEVEADLRARYPS